MLVQLASIWSVRPSRPKKPNELLVVQPLQFALVQGVTLGKDGNKLDLGTYGTTTMDQVRQII